MKIKMTNYTDEAPKAAGGKFIGFDHITLYVGNAKQSASYYTTRFGFELFAYQGLETGSRQLTKYVLKQDKIFFVFVSSYDPNDTIIGDHLIKHGDGIKDIAFEVEQLDNIVKRAKEQGAIFVRDIWEEHDEHGTVRLATVKTFGDTTHTLVERNGYKGFFLPGFQAHQSVDNLQKLLPPVGLNFIDHLVGNQPINEMEVTVQWYEKLLGFHRAWSVDDTEIKTNHSAIRVVVLNNWDKAIKFLISEPTQDFKKNPVAEFIEYYGGAGVQHVAFHTDDIITAMKNLRARGVEFLAVNNACYDMLRKRLPDCKIQIK